MDARQLLWSAFVAWLASLSGKDVSALSEQAVSLQVHRLKKARQKLVKSCFRPEQRDELSSLMSQQFILVEKVNTERGNLVHDSYFHGQGVNLGGMQALQMLRQSVAVRAVTPANVKLSKPAGMEIDESLLKC